MSYPIQGSLHVYTPITASTSLPLFLSGAATSPKALIFLPGLLDGLSTVPFIPHLESALKQHGWALAQPHLSCAYKAFGRTSLDEDCEQIKWAVEYLKGIGMQTIVLMGHSTGSQQTIHYLLTQHSTGNGSIFKAILQAPVSDREGASEFLPPELTDKIASVYQVCKAQGTEYKTRAPEEVCDLFFGVDLSIYRAWSLTCPGADDDYFSVSLPDTTSDINDEFSRRALSQTFGRLPLNVPLLALFSGADECTPNVSVTQSQLLARWKSASPPTVFTGHIIPAAKHAPSDPHTIDELVSKVLEFIRADVGSAQRDEARI